jgi:hypothetical protein
MLGRQSGALLLELALAVMTLTIGIVAFMGVLYPNLVATERTDCQDQVRVALERAAELLRHDNFKQLYANRDSTTLPVPELKGTNGQEAVIEIECFVNEAAVPPEFGPVLDLDGDPATRATDASASYKLLPVRLRLEYVEREVTAVRSLFLLLREPDPLLNLGS